MTKDQKYYQANRDKRLSESREWRNSNPARYKAHRKTWRNNRSTEKRDEWLEKNKARCRAYFRKYKKAHPDLVRLWRRKRRQAIRDMSAANVIWQLVSDAAVLKCGICGRRMKKSDRTIDHIVPLSKGGTGDPWNLRIVHLSCNCRKHAKMPEDFDGQREINFSEGNRHCKSGIYSKRKEKARRTSKSTFQEPQLTAGTLKSIT